MVLAMNVVSPGISSAHDPWQGRHYCIPPPHHKLTSLGHSIARLSRPASAASLSVNLSKVLRAKVGEQSQRWDGRKVQVAQEPIESVDSEFYMMGFLGYVRAYGVEFKEGLKGIGVYAAKDMTVVKTDSEKLKDSAIPSAILDCDVTGLNSWLSQHKTWQQFRPS